MNEIERKQVLETIMDKYRYDTDKKIVVNKKTGKEVRGSKSDKYPKLCVHIDSKITKNLRYHRIVFALVYGEFPKEIDHINGNKHDNRIENLRSCSSEENLENRLFAWKPNKDSGLPCIYRKGGAFAVKIRKVIIMRSDKYALFYIMTLLGRRFQ